MNNTDGTPSPKSVAKRIDEVKQLIKKSTRFAQSTLTFAPQSEILKEGQKNDQVYIILDGKVALLKKTVPDGECLVVDRLGPGSFLGLPSFWNQEPSLSSARSETDVTCLLLTREAFYAINIEDSVLGRSLQKLFVSNLSDRYSRIFKLNAQVIRLSQQLGDERNQLQEAIKKLKDTRNQLISQEKLATLGQLLAGIAHEINNPGAALQRSVESLSDKLPVLFEESEEAVPLHEHSRLLKEGLVHPYIGSQEKRDRLEVLEKRYPEMKRSLLRRLSQLPEELFERVAKLLERQDLQGVEQALSSFEVGTLIQGIQISSERINQLVIGLKRYGKGSHNEWEHVDLRDGIRDTLTILNNRLKDYTLRVEMGALPMVRCIAGEINQVWTNLLVNACEATEKGGEIIIRSVTEEGRVCIEISDSGSGIPDGLEESIFETNFSTKHGNNDFGLGLGLSIAKEIVEKHQGNISVKNNPKAGACFKVFLPIS